MRIPRRALATGTAVALVLAAACTGDDTDPAPSTTAPTTTAAPGVDDDPALRALLLEAGDLPAGFAPVADVGDTVTSFCAGEDAAAGLRADGRAVVGFASTPPGRSVVEVVLRFPDGAGAQAFVDQAEAVLARCDEVPDVSGLAFDYGPLDPAVAGALTPVDDVVTADGRSVGSGALRSLVGVYRQGRLAVLVAVLAVEATEAEVTALATTAFAAASRRTTG